MEHEWVRGFNVLDKKIALSVAKTIGVYLQSRYRRLRSRGNVILEKQSVMEHEWVRSFNVLGGIIDLTVAKRNDDYSQSE